jgi:hypothetical protein
MSNYCIKERKEERKMRGPGGAWKGPYLDLRGALGGSQRVSQGTLSWHLGASIGALNGPNRKP